MGIAKILGMTWPLRRIAAACAAGVVAAMAFGTAYGQALNPPVPPPAVTAPVPRVTPTPQPQIVPPAAPPQAQVEVPSGPPVKIDEVRLEGVTVYDRSSLAPLYAGIVGFAVPRERLEAVVQALQARYRRDGYLLTVVRGEARAERGRLVFIIRAIEGYINAVKLAGDIGPAGRLAYRFLEHLTHIRPTNNADLERWLLLVQDIPGVTVHAVLRHAPGAGPGAVELVAQLARKPFDAQFQYDNRGSDELGPHEALLSGGSNSFTNFGERIEGTFFNTFNREQIYGQVSVSAFLGDQGLRVHGYAGRGNSEPGGVLAPLRLDSDLTVASAGLGYPVIRSRRLNLSLDGTFDYYDSPLLVTVFSPPLRSEASLRILRGGGSLDFQDAAVADLPAANLAILRLSQGLPAWGAFSDLRLGNTVTFTKVTGELTRVQTLPSFGSLATALKVSLGGQYTQDVLPPSEKFFLGGFRFGRGFFSGEITGDRALGASTELQLNTSFHGLPVVAEKRRFEVQFYGFFDYGESWDLGPLAADHHLASLGLGARSDLTPWLFVELEGVRRLTTRPAGAGPTVSKLSDYAVFSRVVLHY